MTRRFPVLFKGNVKLIVNDIIDFEQDQINQIKGIAMEYEKEALQKGKKYGIPLSYITEDQKSDVLNEKHNVVDLKTSQELKDKKIILIGGHSLERILKRIGSTDDNVIITLIDKLKKSDTVTEAQFKGFPTLSYTLLENEDPDKYTFAISFVLGKKESRIIKMVTVHLKNNELEETEFRISDINAEYLAKLSNMKKLIQEQMKEC